MRLLPKRRRPSAGQLKKRGGALRSGGGPRSSRDSARLQEALVVLLAQQHEEEQVLGASEEQRGLLRAEGGLGLQDQLRDWAWARRQIQHLPVPRTLGADRRLGGRIYGRDRGEHEALNEKKKENKDAQVLSPHDKKGHGLSKRCTYSTTFVCIFVVRPYTGATRPRQNCLIDTQTKQVGLD